VVILVLISVDLSIACSGTEFSCSTPTTFQDRRPDKSVLSIATFNAEWLFWSDGNNGPSVRCPLDHSSGTCPWADKTQLDAHLQVVADFLVKVNADIVTLVEVLDCMVLQCLIDAMGDPSYKPYLIPGRDSATDQNVGIISRIDPINALFRDEQRATIYSVDSTCGNLPEESYESGVSKHFIARFNIVNLGQISLIGAHLLAFPTTPDRCVRREAQATVLRNIAQNERNLGRQVVILGDINDYDRDVLDASDSIPTSRVSILLKYDDSGRKIMDSVIESVSQQPSRYSSWWDQDNDCIVEDGELTLIDHLLISPILTSRVLSVQLYNTVIEECDSLESDHYPIKVVLDTSSMDTVEDQTKLEELPNDEANLSSSSGWTTTVFIISFIILGIFIGIGLFVYLKRQQNPVKQSYGTFN